MLRDRRYRGVRDCRHARHRRMARKVAEPTLHAAGGISGSPSHLEGSFPDTDPRTDPTQNLGTCRQYHERFHLGDGHPRLRCISGLGRQTLRLEEEEVSLWSPWARPRPSSLVVAKDQVIPAQCEGVVMARLESSLGVENSLAEPSPEAHLPGGQTNRLEVPERVLNATRRDQKLTKGSS
jgi:hypothetical protein